MYFTSPTTSSTRNQQPPIRVSFHVLVMYNNNLQCVYKLRLIIILQYIIVIGRVTGPSGKYKIYLSRRHPCRYIIDMREMTRKDRAREIGLARTVAVAARDGYTSCARRAWTTGAYATFGAPDRTVGDLEPCSMRYTAAPLP